MCLCVMQWHIAYDSLWFHCDQTARELSTTHTHTYTQTPDTSVVTCSSWHLPARTPSGAPPQDTSTCSNTLRRTHGDTTAPLSMHHYVFLCIFVYLLLFFSSLMGGCFAYTVCTHTHKHTHSWSKHHKSKHWRAHSVYFKDQYKVFRLCHWLKLLIRAPTNHLIITCLHSSPTN